MWLVQVFDRTTGVPLNVANGYLPLMPSDVPRTWRTSFDGIDVPTGDAWDGVVHRKRHDRGGDIAATHARLGLTAGTFESRVHSGGRDIEKWWGKTGGALWWEVITEAHVEAFIELASLGQKTAVSPHDGTTYQYYAPKGELPERAQRRRIGPNGDQYSIFPTAKIASVTEHYRQAPFWERRGIHAIRAVQVLAASVSWNSTSDAAIEALQLPGDDGAYEDALYTELRAQLIARV